MRRINYFQYLAMMMLIVASLCTTLTSCENKEDEPNQGEDLNVYPWKDHPKSYIRMFDSRMELKMLSIRRDGTSLLVDYTLTNVGFGVDVTLKINLNKNGAHDNLGNTYKASVNWPGIIGYINGTNLYAIPRVEFLPNQTIKGSFTLLEFDPDATAFSVSVDVQRDKPIGLTLAGDRMDFVNIPVD